MSQEIVLVVASLVSGVISGVMGMIGGIVLLSVMTLYFSAAEAIPLHGVVQFFSNLSRVFFHWAVIKKEIMLYFAVGVALGSFLGSQVVVDIPRLVYDLILGILILLITWLDKQQTHEHSGGPTQERSNRSGHPHDEIHDWSQT